MKLLKMVLGSNGMQITKKILANKKSFNSNSNLPHVFFFQIECDVSNVGIGEVLLQEGASYCILE